MLQPLKALNRQNNQQSCIIYGGTATQLTLAFDLFFVKSQFNKYLTLSRFTTFLWGF